jgi:2,3,4,5-tetrahydropyridine-2-carboxylate N-succinyltransferase
MNNLNRDLVEEAFENREKLSSEIYQTAVMEVLDRLDRGQLRVAQKNSLIANPREAWTVNAWVKKAILLYFSIQQLEKIDSGPFEYLDKIPIKSRLRMPGVRVVPGAVIRKGAFVEPGVILMPSCVNIGAYVAEATMVDTWATVGSCAQVGKRVHLSGGVGLGGVLEPAQASPVIIEDHVFVGSRAIIVEGAYIAEGAVIGANVVITASTKILDVSGSQTVEYTGYVPPRSVVIPGTREKEFPAGRFGVPCALIIGQRRPSTDEKTSLNDALRDFGVAV